MPVTVTVQPAEGMAVQVVHGPMDPPSLVLSDGTVTVVLAPASVRGGMAVAAEFAKSLMHVAGIWEQVCARQVALANSADPFDVATLVQNLGLTGEQTGTGDDRPG